MQIAAKYPDVFFTPEYQELFKDTAFGGEPCHFNTAGIDYRFYKRPIEGTPYFDIVSPYGYSGPVALFEHPDWNDFRDCFADYCKERNVIAEFARIHPLISRLAAHRVGDNFDCEKYEHDIFYIDLMKSEDEIWKGFDKGCRSAIKKAQSDSGITMVRAAQEFAQLYWDTMDRTHAKENYSFRFDTIGKLIALGNLFTCWRKGKVVSGAILLNYGDYCHYFLSASNGDNSGATNLLIWSAIKWAKSQGCKIFNLGGGLKAGDSLESFKRSFSHDSKPFYTYRKIHNPDVYAELSKGIVTDYFPAYLAERTKQ